MAHWSRWFQLQWVSFGKQPWVSSTKRRSLGVTRLLWVGKERTIESFQGFFTTIGDEITSKIVFICSDMWEPYLKVIREKCSEALILHNGRMWSRLARRAWLETDKIALHA